MRFDGDMVVLDLRETYDENGTYSFKVVLNPKHFKNGHDAEIVMFDTEARPMDVDVKCWGRKIVCTFTLGGDMIDGVCAVNMKLRGRDGKEVKRFLSFWVIR